MNNLKQIGLGLQVYADIHGCFPPAYIADENGKPMHSWRVLLLPYIEQKALYDQYDFREPWDGQHNRLLADKMPYVYRCWADPTLSTCSTNYVAVTGTTTGWPGTRPTALSDFKDSTAYALAVVEVAGLDVNWMEPRDLPFEDLKNGVNPKGASGVSSWHAGGAWSLFFDGRALWLDGTTSPTSLKALATKAGDETITGDY